MLLLYQWFVMIKIKYFLFGFACCLLICFLIPLALNAFYKFDTGYSLRKTYLNGVQIVKAIDAYHDKEGKYPECLAQLLPEYLPEIPPSYIDVHEWYYYRTEDAYFLGASLGYPVCHYLPATKEWKVTY